MLLSTSVITETLFPLVTCQDEQNHHSSHRSFIRLTRLKWHVEQLFLPPQAIADMVTEEHLAEGRLYPPLSTIREVSFKIAVKVRTSTLFKLPIIPLLLVLLNSDCPITAYMCMLKYHCPIITTFGFSAVK